MKIEHVALWVRDLERMKAFYETYFGCVAGVKYVNEKKNFQSYFLSMGDGPRLELMFKSDVTELGTREIIGMAHLAISVGGCEKVDLLTHRFREAGYKVIGEPRITGDGYYESVILDPEGNRVEITS